MELQPKRLLVIYVYFIAMVLSAFAWESSVVLRKIEDRNNAFWFNFFRYFDLLALVLLYVPSAYVIELLGMRLAALIASVLIAASYWLVLAKQELFGSFLAPLAIPFLWNGITKISTQWYGPRGRMIVLMWLLLPAYVAATVAILIGPDLLLAAFPLGLFSTIFIPIAYFAIQDKPT